MYVSTESTPPNNATNKAGESNMLLMPQELLNQFLYELEGRRKP